MPFDNYFIIDVETCPMDMQKHDVLAEEDRKQLINPIDSKASSQASTASASFASGKGEGRRIYKESMPLES